MDIFLEHIDVIITAIITGFGGYALSSINHRRSTELSKSNHLRDLFSEYAQGLNLLFNTSDELIDFAESLHKEKYTHDIAEEFVKELDEAIEMDKKYTDLLNNVNIKFNFKQTLRFEKEIEEYFSKLNSFIDFLEKVETRENILIGDGELKYIKQVEQYLKKREDMIYEKMQQFYSSQYLPKQVIKKLKL